MKTVITCEEVRQQFRHSGQLCAFSDVLSRACIHNHAQLNYYSVGLSPSASSAGFKESHPTHLNEAPIWQVQCFKQQSLLYRGLHCHHGNVERQWVMLSSSTCLKIPTFACKWAK